MATNVVDTGVIEGPGRLGTVGRPAVKGERIRRRYGEGEAAVDALRGVSLESRREA